MAVCTYCGAELSGTEKFCTNCGAAVPQAETIIEAEVVEAEDVFESVEDQEEEPEYIHAEYVEPETITVRGPEIDDSDRNLRLAAFVLNIVCCVLSCWLVFPLIWMIPMTVRTWSIYKCKKPNTMVFAICNLIFCSPISGVLLLISKKDA